MPEERLDMSPGISDSDFTDEELAIIYGLDLYMGALMLREDHTEHELERMGAWG